MLRHFKMELKRQQQLSQLASQENSRPEPDSLLAVACQAQDPAGALHPGPAQGHQPKPAKRSPEQCLGAPDQPDKSKRSAAAAKRVRGRRSSKPMMEKRRRARINECLDILKSYVLNDSTNLSRLGIELGPGAENLHDEETIAREILKSSGLINRHKGRKNPNKLEKADILELTVDYVRRLHEQRNELLLIGAHAGAATPLEGSALGLAAGRPIGYQLDAEPATVPVHLNQPLTLDLSPKSRLACQPTPITPPPSSASSSPHDQAPLVAPYRAHHQHPGAPFRDVSQALLSQVFDTFRHCEWPPAGHS